MKIFGYWGRFDAPYVEVRVVCKKFGIDRKIRFLIDIPSLLGRDFLNQMALLVDHRNDLVLITDEVLTA